MSQEKITFDEITQHAIVEGFEGGIHMFMEDLETTLYNDTLIQEAGGVNALIDQALQPSYAELNSKLRSVLG